MIKLMEGALKLYVNNVKIIKNISRVFNIYFDNEVYIFYCNFCAFSQTQIAFKKFFNSQPKISHVFWTRVIKRPRNIYVQNNTPAGDYTKNM